MTVRWLPFVLMAAMNGSGWGQSQAAARFPLTAGLVARALSLGGVQADEEQVSLAANVVATEAEPALDVVAVEPIGEDRSRVKLACHAFGSCVPFYALVDRPAVAFPAKFATPAKAEILMRAGAHAVLVMDDAHSHIQVTVVSLENGTAGKWIRVASPDHKQTYMGEVIGATLLRGNY